MATLIHLLCETTMCAVTSSVDETIGWLGVIEIGDGALPPTRADVVIE